MNNLYLDQFIKNFKKEEKKVFFSFKTNSINKDFVLHSDNITFLLEMPEIEDIWKYALKQNCSIDLKTDYITYYLKFYFDIFLLFYVKNSKKESYKLKEEEFDLIKKKFYRDIEYLDFILKNNDRHFSSLITNKTFYYIQDIYVVYIVIAYSNQEWFNNAEFVWLNNYIDNFTYNQMLNCLADGEKIRYDLFRDLKKNNHIAFENIFDKDFHDFIFSIEKDFYKKQIDAADILDLFKK